MLDPGIRAALAAEDKRLTDLEATLAAPEGLAPTTLRARLRELGSLQKHVGPYREYIALESQLADAREMERDPELRELAQAEVTSLESQLETHANQLVERLLSRHELSDRNVMVEIRAGVGGDEATLWSADLARMYLRYAERHGLKSEVVSQQRTEVGGFKEVVIAFAGEDAYDQLRFESGGHRVQRVPATETQGRVHTSAATVAVMAEPEDVEVQIKESDLRVETFRAGGPGGQNVNKTSSAVRITHVPTGVVVSCQDESSQHKNKSKAMRTLRTRLFEAEQNQRKAERDSTRREQIGSGDRGDKIRTYNYPQDRVTDHRIKRSFHPLPSILDGELGEIVQALRRFEIERRLEALQAGS